MTYTPQDALTFAKEFIKNQPLDRLGVSPVVVDAAAKFFWMYAPWKWTIGSLTPILLTSAVNYTITTPADFHALQLAWVVDAEKETWLDIMPDLPLDPKQSGVSRRIAYIAGAPDVLRLFPAPVEEPNKVKYLMSFYKKVHAQINSGNMNSTSILGFPDEWFPVFLEILLYFAYKYADDQRAGGAQVQGQNVSYSGQYGIVIAQLEQMKSRVDLLVGFPGEIQSRMQR